MMMIECEYCHKFFKGYKGRKFCNKSCANQSHALLFATPYIKRIKEIIESFKKTRSLTETGKVFNLTRERIRQIIKIHASELNNTKGSLVKVFTKYFGLPCKGCKRKLGIEIKHASYGYCKGCRSYLDHLDEPDWKPPVKFTKCSECDKPLEKGDSFSKGLCQRHYNWYRYQIYPEVRRKHSLVQKKWSEKKKSDPEWWKKYKIRQRTHFHKWYEKNR
ncbi:MAG: hypothetical protein AABY22_32370 [Nanoarchaeota archaeon]